MTRTGLRRAAGVAFLTPFLVLALGWCCVRYVVELACGIKGRSPS